MPSVKYALWFFDSQPLVWAAYKTDCGWVPLDELGEGWDPVTVPVDGPGIPTGTIMCSSVEEIYAMAAMEMAK